MIRLLFIFLIPLAALSARAGDPFSDLDRPLIAPTATDYYFSTSGSDGNAGTQLSPWQTLSKLSTTLLSLGNGDRCLLKRGDTWVGQLKIASFAGNTRTLGAYGTGAKPVITGLQTLTSWSSLGGNKYEANMSTSLSRVGTVVIDGLPRAMGRYPNDNPTNGGYLVFTGGTSTTITGTDLPNSPSYIGWEIVVRKRQFIMDKGPVSGQSSGTFTFSPTDGSGWAPDGIGNGFFFQNNYSALDTAYEWYYNSSPARLDVYLPTAPSNYSIRVSGVDTVAYIYAQNNLTIDNIRFEGSNMETFRANNNNNFSVTNCEFVYSGLDAVRVFACTQVTWAGNLIEHAGNDAAYFEAAESTTITNSVFKASGVTPGMGKSNGLSYLGIVLGASSTGGVLMQNCTVDSIGYNGIHIAGNNITIKNNYVNNFNRTIDDGAGIYSSHAGYTESGRLVRGNIVTNGRGNKFGTNLGFYTSSIGIYFDDQSSNVTIDSNTVAYMSDAGIYGHNNENLIIRDNYVYDAKTALQFQHDAIAPSSPIRGMNVKRNHFVAKPGQIMFQYLNYLGTDLDQIGSIDSNYYWRPSSDGTAIISTNQTSGTNNYTMAQWKALGRDVFTQQTPAGIVGDSILLQINPTSATANVNVNLDYVNNRGVGFTGANIAVKPYSSLLLIRKNLGRLILPGRRILQKYP